ncbi:MAG: TOTE conflict system archaeo-eukaryotic primase domain-containing protein, partial [Halanaerobiales bacterium]
DISYDNYLKKFNKEQYYYRKSAQLLFELYAYKRKKWLIQLKGGQYVTIKHLKYYEKVFEDSSQSKKDELRKKYRKWPLCESDMKKHVEGRTTLGVYFPESFSKMIGLDIDMNDSCQALEALERVYEALYSLGIPQQAVLSSYSGNKGYHVDIFLSRMLDAEKIKKFYYLILQETDYQKKEIELRGIGRQGYKLPLGIHRKTGNFCYCCNEYGVEIKDNEKILEKLETIEKVSTEVIMNAIEMNDILYFTEKEKKEVQELQESYKGLGIYNNPVESLISSYWKKGLVREESRHFKAFTLGIAYREKGYCQKKIEKKLLEWHRTLDDQYYESSWVEIEKDCRKIAKSVMNEKYQLPVIDVSKEAVITKKELRMLLKVKRKADRELLFALINHAKIYAGKEGIFFMTYTQMNESLGKNKRNQQFLEQLQRLEKEGYIEIISRNEKKENSYKKKSNKYRVRGLDFSVRAKIEKKKRILKICSKKKCRNCMNRVICTFFSKKEINEKLNYRQAKKLHRTKPCPRSSKIV